MTRSHILCIARAPLPVRTAELAGVPSGRTTDAEAAR